MAVKCLNPQQADVFLKALREGKIDPEKMSNMETEARRDFLAKYVGKDNAKFVNTEFEGKLLLKNQKLGMINWAKKTAGLNERTRKDIVDKIDKLDRALNPKEQENFLTDIVEKKLGIAVTEKEASKIIELTNAVREVADAKDESHDNLMEYNRRKKKLVDYIASQTPTLPTDAIWTEKFGKNASEILSVGRAIKTGFDFSAPLRQGFALFGTKEWGGAFRRMFNYAADQNAFDELEVEMMSHKYSEEIFKVKRELGLTMFGETFTQREEAFASKLIDKIPGLNNTARAYEGFLNDLRFNRFVNILQQLDDGGNGIKHDVKAMKDLAKVIGSATGRGHLGRHEGSSAAKSLATVLFSPRYLTSRVQLLINPAKPGLNPIARKEAAKSLARTIGTSSAILTLAALAGADVEKDPRSADFGKVKIGNTRFDITGGTAPYIVFMWRQFKGEIKSTVTGKVIDLKEMQFGGLNRFLIAEQFLTNKASPITRAIIDALKGKDFEGKPVNLDPTSKELYTWLADVLIWPMVATDTIEAYQEASGNEIAMAGASLIASTFGIGSSSYQYTPKGKKWESLKEQIGDDRYQSAVEAAQTMLRDELDRLETDGRFIEAPETGDDSQAKMIDKVKRDVEKRVLDQFGYRKPRRR